MGVGITADALQTQIQGLHNMAAIMTGMPFVALKEEEAKELAVSLHAVAEQSGIALSGPRAAWIRLGACLGMIYVPRAIMARQYALAVRAQRAEQAATPEAAANGTGGQMNFDAANRPMFGGVQ